MWKCLIVIGIFSVLTACKSTPPPEEPKPQQENPSAVLELTGMEAISVKRAAIHYRLTISNPRSQALNVQIKNWNGLLNGNPFDAHSAVLNVGGTPEAAFGTEPHSTIEKPLVLNLDLDGGTEYCAELALELGYLYGHSGTISDTVSVQVTFPGILEPEFAITSITILQADLINTRLKLGMRISNPNIFPVTLSSFRFQLYGDGNFWADGTEKDLSVIPAQASVDTGITIDMNFIGMRRGILDDIIAMRQVHYRIAGNVEVGTDTSWLPVFRKNFDLSGFSPVLK